MRMSKRADPHGLRSKHRSALRLCLGTAYYSAQRYLLWMSGKYRFASQRQKDRLPCVHMAHHTPLLRKLKDVEMQYQHNKITNLKLAVARLDGIVVQPGETLSYWKLIGRPTYRKGYLDGVLLKNGTVQYGCGGGLCQLSNLIFWMTLHTPLEVKERHHEMRHEWWGGCSRHNELYLQVFDLEGELLEDRLVVENHAMMMYTPFLEDNAPDGGREEEEK